MVEKRAVCSGQGIDELICQGNTCGAYGVTWRSDAVWEARIGKGSHQKNVVN